MLYSNLEKFVFTFVTVYLLLAVSGFSGNKMEQSDSALAAPGAAAGCTCPSPVPNDGKGYGI